MKKYTIPIVSAKSVNLKTGAIEKKEQSGHVKYC